MKKLLIGLTVVILMGFVGLKVAEHMFLGGDDYYVKITTDGERKEGKDDSGKPYVDYAYSLPAYDKDGKEKQLDFSATKDRPLRKDAYLKLTWNKKAGVTGYEEVKQAELPQKAREKLDK